MLTEKMYTLGVWRWQGLVVVQLCVSQPSSAGTREVYPDPGRKAAHLGAASFLLHRSLSCLCLCPPEIVPGGQARSMAMAGGTGCRMPEWDLSANHREMLSVGLLSVSFFPRLLVLQGVLSRWMPNSICTPVDHPSFGQFSCESISQGVQCLAWAVPAWAVPTAESSVSSSWLLVRAGLLQLCFHLRFSRCACSGQGFALVKSGSLC